MFSGDGTPETVPRVRIVVQLEENLETCDRGFSVCHLEFLVDGRSEQKVTHGVHQRAAPELVGMAGRHTDHVEERSDKAAAYQSMMRCRFIEVICTSDGHDGFEMRRPFNGSLHLCTGEIANPNHADIAVRPRLLRGPLDKVVHVATFLSIKEAEGPARATGAPTVGNDVNVTSWDEEITGSRFNEARRRTKVLNLPRIGRGGNQYGISAGFGRTMHI